MGIAMFGNTNSGQGGNFYLWIGVAGNFNCGMQGNGPRLETYNKSAVAGTTYSLHCEYDPASQFGTIYVNGVLEASGSKAFLNYPTSFSKIRIGAGHIGDTYYHH